MTKNNYKVKINSVNKNNVKIKCKLCMDLEPYLTIFNNIIYRIFFQSRIWKENSSNQCIMETCKKKKDSKKNMDADDNNLGKAVQSRFNKEYNQ